MHFHGFLHFKRLILILSVFCGNLLYAGSGLTVLGLPEDPVNGWFSTAPGGLSNAASWPVLLPEKPVSWQGTHGFWMFDTPYSRVMGGSRDFFAGASFLKTEGIEIRTDVADDEPVGETGYYNGTLFAGREWVLSPKIRLGTTGQIVFERLYHASALGFALNLTGAYRINDFSFVTAGVRNLGKMEDLYQKATPLPLDVYTGVFAETERISAGIALHSDAKAALYGTGLVKYTINSLLSVGLSYSGLTNSWHAGGDIQYKQFRFGVGQFFMQDQIAYPVILSIGYIPDKH